MDIRDLYKQHRQSIWLDYIRRDLLKSGELENLVDGGIRGVTSNPSIFEKAIGESTDYDAAIAELDARGEMSAAEIYEALAVDDIRHAAGILRRVYNESDAVDGYVSLEVSPHLANDAAKTIEEARRLWRKVDRENLMVKVPATFSGVRAIEQLISEGININVTLLFGRDECLEVANAYMSGLESRLASGQEIRNVASVASMFVSRIDSAIDVPEFAGKVAIANAKLAYRDWCDLIASARWKKLAAHGARPQRLLWASTSTKDPKFSDVMYVEALMGPDTVNTVPRETLEAFRDHGSAHDQLTSRTGEAAHLLARLATSGISIDLVTQTLLQEGVKKFSDSFDALLAAIEKKRGPAHELRREARNVASAMSATPDQRNRAEGEFLRALVERLQPMLRASMRSRRIVVAHDRYGDVVLKSDGVFVHVNVSNDEELLQPCQVLEAEPDLKTILNRIDAELVASNDSPGKAASSIVRKASQLVHA